MKCLIVEDDFTSRLLLQQALSRYGECHIAVNGREAIAAFREARTAGSPYDLICMDIMMPEMDGQTALKQIRAIEEAADRDSDRRPARVVMTTALGDLTNVSAAYREFCDAYLCKPVDTAKLLSHLHAFNLLEPALAS